jgi:hypothetical protein
MRLYPRIGHLPGSRTGPGDRHLGLAIAARLTAEEQAGDRVIVQEKLDGSCVVVCRREGRLVAMGREGRPAAESRNEGRRRFAAWAAENAGRFDALGEGERAACEWLPIAHGTRYALPHEPVALLDLFTADGRRSGIDAVIQFAGAAGLPRPAVLHDGGALPVAEALARLGEHGRHGALDAAEGVVYRIERRGLVLSLGKWVRHGKQDGCYLADHTGLDHVHNTWLPPDRR